MATDTATVSKAQKRKNNTAVSSLLSVDCHSHVLPEIDDGSDSVETSIKMLEELKAQGISVVYATPHFRAHKDNVDEFLENRQKALEKILSMDVGDRIPQIKLGAEIAVEPGISNVADIDKLTMGESRCILLEYPYREYSRWATEEIENIAYRYDLVPILAHLDRYSEMFSKSDYAEILQISSAIFQINNEAFKNRHAKKLLRFFKDESLPIVLGSDCHNLKSRKPNFTVSCKKMKKTEPAGAAAKFLELTQGEIPAQGNNAGFDKKVDAEE